MQQSVFEDARPWLQQRLFGWMQQSWPKEAFSPGGVSYVLCSLIKNPEEEDPPRSTRYKFFEWGPFPPGSWLGNTVNRNPPRGFFFWIRVSSDGCSRVSSEMQDGCSRVSSSVFDEKTRSVFGKSLHPSSFYSTASIWVTSNFVTKRFCRDTKLIHNLMHTWHGTCHDSISLCIVVVSLHE